MAYTGLTIETTVHDAGLSSHCIPAYPQYNTLTIFGDSFYDSRQASNNDLAGATIILIEES